jgi:carotenoid 1,2-hydratase
MPTLPLYEPNSPADAWHQVRSPGGYEWWYFDAEDRQRSLQIVGILLQGFIFHPGYLRAYASYIRKPKKTSPPLPEEYPCAYFVVYEHGRILHQFMTQYRPDDFSASMDAPDVTIGPNSLSAQGSALNLKLQGTPWILTMCGPKRLEDQPLLGEFKFEPLLDAPPHKRSFLSQAICGGAEHQWVVANPLCRVSGSFQCNGQTREFSGTGYHDHNYGTAPIGRGLRRWIWGRVLLDDSVYTFHYVQPQDATQRDEIHMIQADSTGMREITIQRVDAAWSRRTGWLLNYPDALRFDSALELSNPRVIDSSPFYLRLSYDARVANRQATALCEIAYPHRLRGPVLGRMIEMSIDKRPARQP